MLLNMPSGQHRMYIRLMPPARHCASAGSDSKSGNRAAPAPIVFSRLRREKRRSRFIMPIQGGIPVAPYGTRNSRLRSSIAIQLQAHGRSCPPRLASWSSGVRSREARDGREPACWRSPFLHEASGRARGSSLPTIADSIEGRHQVRTRRIQGLRVIVYGYVRLRNERLPQPCL